MEIPVFDYEGLCRRADEDDYSDLDMWIDLVNGPACEYCGCTEDDACPGGCAWSEKYQMEGRAVCTRCENIEPMIEINLATLRIWAGGFAQNPFVR